MRVFLVRHAQPSFNLHGGAGRLCGRSNPHLTARGQEEAQSVAGALRHLRSARVASSTLYRALETAHPIAAATGSVIVQYERLREVDYGLLEGLTKRELLDCYPDPWKQYETDPYSTRPPDGESAADAHRRAHDALQDLATVDCVIAVGHKTIWRILIAAWCGTPLSEFRKLNLRLASISEFAGPNLGKLRPIRINGVSHLTSKPGTKDL